MYSATEPLRGELCPLSGALPSEVGLVLQLSAPKIQAGFANDSWEDEAIGWSGREP